MSKILATPAMSTIGNAESQQNSICDIAYLYMRYSKIIHFLLHLEDPLILNQEFDLINLKNFMFSTHKADFMYNGLLTRCSSSVICFKYLTNIYNKTRYIGDVDLSDLIYTIIHNNQSQYLIELGFKYYTEHEIYLNSKYNSNKMQDHIFIIYKSSNNKFYIIQSWIYVNCLVQKEYTKNDIILFLYYLKSIFYKHNKYDKIIRNLDDPFEKYANDENGLYLLSKDLTIKLDNIIENKDNSSDKNSQKNIEFNDIDKSIIKKYFNIHYVNEQGNHTIKLFKFQIRYSYPEPPLAYIVNAEGSKVLTTMKDSNSLQAQPQSHAQAPTQSRPQAFTQSHAQALTQSRPQALTQSRPQALTQSRPQAFTQSRPQAFTQSHAQALTQSRPQALFKAHAQASSTVTDWAQIQAQEQAQIQAQIQAHTPSQHQLQSKITIQQLPDEQKSQEDDKSLKIPDSHLKALKELAIILLKNKDPFTGMFKIINDNKCVDILHRLIEKHTLRINNYIEEICIILNDRKLTIDQQIVITPYNLKEIIGRQGFHETIPNTIFNNYYHLEIFRIFSSNGMMKIPDFLYMVNEILLKFQDLKKELDEKKSSKTQMVETQLGGYINKYSYHCY